MDSAQTIFGSVEADARAFGVFARAIGLGSRVATGATFPVSFFRAGIFAALRDLYELRLALLSYEQGGKPDVPPSSDRQALTVLDALYCGLSELDDTELPE